MTKRDLFIDEFLAITEAFLAKPERVKFRSAARLTVSREDLKKLFEKNLYEEPGVKLKMWRNMRWIQADEGRTSCRYYDTEGKQRRGISIDLMVYEALKALGK